MISARRIRQLVRAARLLPHAAGLVRRHGRPSAILYFGESPGDDLLATAVLRQWHEVRGSRAAYLTSHPTLFDGSADTAFTAPYDPELAAALQLLGVPRRRLTYHAYDPDTDRSVAPREEHIINMMCREAGLPTVANPRPVLRLAPVEIVRVPRTRIVIQSSVLSARMPIANKDWYPDRMQAVADALGRDAEIVQLGTPADPALSGVVDMRGRTTLRGAAGILAGAQVFIGMVGFLMHLATAVGTRSVVIFGGREHPDQSGYPENVNLFTGLPCSPCWLWNTCPYDRECMRRIEAADVIKAARALLADEQAPGFI